MRLGEHFIKHQVASEGEIKQALDIQALSGGKIGEILLAITKMRPVDYYQILAQFYELPFRKLSNEQIDLSLLQSTQKEKYFAESSIPIAFDGEKYTIATADPSTETFALLKKEYGEQTIFVCSPRFDILWALRQQFGAEYLETAIFELSQKNARLSAKYVTPLWLRVLYCLPFCAMIGLFFVDTRLALLLLNCFILVGLSFIVVFKVVLSLIGFFQFKKKERIVALVKQDDLPIYSILVPLYKENALTLNSLFKHLQELIYPTHKLDIKILLEEDDIETINLIKKMRLPSYIEYVYIPAGEPRTKAKACNYGFKFVRGDYLCLYDAEDRPDPDQLLKVIQEFRAHPEEKIACVQCKLNFFNSDENWLTRMFTIEYTYWFDLLLPALEFTGIPIPLGGTSNHFRTDILRSVCAWDPFNVTEDADLGLRLSRLGFITKVLDSITYEEANCQLWNWLKQRTRWIKGYMQTYLVHMRNPFELWYKVGTKGFLGFQLFVGGTILSNLANIPMWLITFSVILLPQFDIHYYFPPWLHFIALLNLYIGTLGLVTLNVMGVIVRKKRHLLFSALTAPFYWMLMSLASYRAFYQLIFAPSYWDKTEHGISQTMKPNSVVVTENAES